MRFQGLTNPLKPTRLIVRLGRRPIGIALPWERFGARRKPAHYRFDDGTEKIPTKLIGATLDAIEAEFF